MRSGITERLGISITYRNHKPFNGKKPWYSNRIFEEFVKTATRNTDQVFQV